MLNIQWKIKEILLAENLSNGTKPLDNRSMMFEEEFFMQENQGEHYNVDILKDQMKKIRLIRKCECKEEKCAMH